MSSNTQYANQAPGATGVDPNHPAELDYRVEVVDADAGVVKCLPEPRRKIAVCGFAASSRPLAPFDDPEWEVWGLNQLYRHIPRATRWFDIHANWREDNVPGTDHEGWLAKCGIPIYMSAREPSLPTAVTYPIDGVIRRVIGVDYETSTVAFMVALAIDEIDAQVGRELEGAAVAGLSGIGAAHKLIMDAYARREIGVFGIDLIVGKEYDWQKACVEYLLGCAHARNITIRLPKQCALLRQQWRYGYETEPQGGLIKLTELQRRGEALAAERANLMARLNQIDGASQENGYWNQVADLRSKGGTVKLNEDT